MYNMFQQLRLFTYNQLLSKKVSSTKIGDVEGKDVPQNAENNDLQKNIANLEENERILLENSTISCREIKSKSYTDIKDSTKTILSTARKCLSLSDLKRHIACISIKKLTRTQKKDIMKPNIICSSGDSKKKHESIKSRHQIRRKDVATDECHSSSDLFGFYKNRRRKHNSPYELYIQSGKPVISKNINKLKKCGSKVIRRERSAKHIPFLSCHHALKVITSKHGMVEVADDVFDSLQCVKNHGELNYSLSIPIKDHKKQQDLPTKNESIMCHLPESRVHKHHPKKKRRVSYSIPKDNSVDVACSNVSADHRQQMYQQSIELPVVITQDLQAMDGSADQSLGLPKLISQNLAPEHEFGCSPAPCFPNCKCMYRPSHPAIKGIDDSTQTITCKHSYRTHSFSSLLPKPYKKSVQFIANLHINNPDPKSIIKCILICLLVTVWSPILLAIGIGWLLSYPLRPCILWERNLKYKRKKGCTCKKPSVCNKSGQTKLQYILQACKIHPSQRHNQKQPYAWSTPCCFCRRRELGRNYSIFHSDCRTMPLHASQHRANTITNFFHSVFCSYDKIHQSNVSSFRNRRKKVALKKKSLIEPTHNDKLTRHPVIEFSPRQFQNSEANKIYPIQDISTTTEPNIKFVNLQTHDDQGKSDEIEASFFFSPLMKLLENYLVNFKFMTPRQPTFLKKSTNGRGLESKQSQWQCFQRPKTNFSKNLRSQARYSRGVNKRMELPQCLSLVSKETKKDNHKIQKVINFADDLSQNTETIKLGNKNIKTDSMNQQIEGTKCLQNEGTKCLHLVSSHCTSPVCDKTKEANKTIEPDFRLSEPTQHRCAHSFTVHEPLANGHTESLSHRTKEVYTTTEMNNKENLSYNFCPSALSEPTKHPFGDDIAVYKCPVSGHTESLCGTKKAYACVETDQKSNPCANHVPKNVQCIKKNKLTDVRSSFFKFNFSNVTKCPCGKWYKMKKTNVSNGSEKKLPGDSFHKQMHKLTQNCSSSSKYPTSSDAEGLCVLKGKKPNATDGTNQKSKSNCSCQCHLIKPIKLRPAASVVCKCPLCRNSENLCHNCQKMKKANTAVETDQKSKCNSSCQYHLIKPIRLPPTASVVCKCPISRNSENLCYNCQKMKKANAAVETDQKCKSNSSCTCHLIKPIRLPPTASVVCKCPISRNSENLCYNCKKMKKTNAAVETDQKSKSNSSCTCHLIKTITLPPAGSVVCKCPVSRNSEKLCHNNCPKVTKANAAVETDQKCKSYFSCQCPFIKPIKLPPAGSVLCKYPKSRNSENLCHNCQQKKKPNAALKTDKKLKSNTSCQCHLIKPTNFAPAVSSGCKCPISGSTESLCHKRNKANACVRIDQNDKPGSDLMSLPNKLHARPLSPKIFNISKYLKRDKKINTSCQCHLLKPIQLPSDGSVVCKCPSNANTESLCHDCHKKKQANKCVAKASVGTDPKSKISCICERMKLNNVPYDFVHTLFRQDSLNVYKLCPIGGDTDGLKKTKKLKKHRNNKTATNKCIHTPEYLNVCSEVCGSLREKKIIAHCLSNNNEKFSMNKQTRTSKCKPKSPRNPKNYDKCIRESIEAKQPHTNSLKSPFNDSVQRSEDNGKCVTVLCSKCDCKIRGSNESETNTDKVTKNSWTTCYRNAGTTVKTRCANKQCKIRKETQSSDKPIHATKTKICADLRQICLGPPSEQTKFSVEEKKSCSSQTFKKATFSTPYSLSCNEPRCKRRKPMLAKYLAFTFYDFIVGNNRRKKGNKEPPKPIGILIKTSDYTRQNYEKEPQQCYGGLTELKSRNINTALSPMNIRNKIDNLKADRRKNFSNKSMEFSYFTMLKDLIESKTFQNRNVYAQYNKTNSQQCPIPDSKPLDLGLDIPDPKPSFPVSCSCEHGVSGQKKQQKGFSPHNSNIKETSQWQDFSPQTNKKLDATRSKNTPNTSNPRPCSKRNRNIQEKLSKLRSLIITKTSKQTLSSQCGGGFNNSKPNEVKVSPQLASNILEAKEQKLCSNITETKAASKKAKLSRERISDKGDGTSFQPDCFHLRPAMVTGKGDNSLSFSDKRDLIKMCFKRKVKLTPSLVKCLSDNFNLVSTQHKNLPRIIEHIKYDKCCEHNKRHQNKVKCTGSPKISAGIKADYTRTKTNKPNKQHNLKGMEEAEKRKPRHVRKTRKPSHSSKICHRKIPERKGFWVRHIPDKKLVIKKPVKKKIVKKKTVSKKLDKSSRKQTSINSGDGDELQCSSLYLATLREKPWFWVYTLLPKCYPNFLRFRLCSKTICTQCAFSLTCCVWAPFVVICLICYELFTCGQ